MGRTLLLIELKGGNDGLNTVIPYADAKYHELRPGIGVARDHTIQLDEKVGLHNKLEPLMESWKAGDLPIPTARISVRSRSGTLLRPRTRP
jgi:uncharacterized protein (DUF1501 family)